VVIKRSSGGGNESAVSPNVATRNVLAHYVITIGQVATTDHLTSPNGIPSAK